ncbi:hypothetical protein [uncultured Rhodospira sp.]|uniref:hypothetical protein n=1 Tax=uncultured Rhodospira sp. TaxID=1936189 RepID=UPI002625E6F5|nr:hypothetical protein [uncultured Rhodospira sp.]
MAILITPATLATLRTDEVQGLYTRIFNDLVRSAPGTPERRTALASLENIERFLASRSPGP